MTKLDEFIQELCPDGVKYLPIPELFITRNGYTPSKANNEFWETLYLIFDYPYKYYTFKHFEV